MVGLLLETSTEKILIGLIKNEALVEVRTLQAPGQTHQIVAVLAELLKRHGYATADLDWLAVGVGPGSYTGIRAGVVIAKSIAFAHRTALIPVPSLRCFPIIEEGPFTVLLDAKIGGVYALRGEKKKGNVRYAEAGPQLWPLERIPSEITEDFSLVTPSGERLRQRLSGLLPNSVRWLEVEMDPWTMLEFVQEQKKLGKVNQTSAIEILYLRKTQAEIESELS